ncbi:MAG: DUF2523 domain-containing protein [Gallionella sp.]
MSSYGLYLASVAAPIAQRVLIGLGIGTITYIGLDAAFTTVKDGVVNNWGQVPQGALAVLTAAGVGQAVGIVLGAIAARVVMIQVKKLGVL